MRVGRPERPVKQPAVAGETNRRLPPSRQAPEGGRGGLYGPTFSVPGPPAASAGQRLVPQELLHAAHHEGSRYGADGLSPDFVMTLFRA